MNSDSAGAERREKLFGLLGDLPPRVDKVAAVRHYRRTLEGFEVERLDLNLNGIETVPAFFTKPIGATGKLPTIIYNHASGETLGKLELVQGREHLQSPSYARALATEGYAALSIDMWSFGERQGRTLDYLFKEMIWKGQVLWGMMVFDTLRAIDYLVTRDDVDPARLGTLGLSLGSTMAWWVAALDPRVKVCADICCLTDFHELIESRGLNGHGVYYYVPSLLKHFTTADINALIAPRAHISVAGNYDPLTPVRGLERIDSELKKTYSEMGAEDAWKLVRYECGHFETADMRTEIINFLRKWL